MRCSCHVFVCLWSRRVWGRLRIQPSLSDTYLHHARHGSMNRTAVPCVIASSRHCCYHPIHCAHACSLSLKRCVTQLKLLSVQARESAQRWETRASDLQQRYGKVDLAEHQRVLAELEATKAELQQLNRQLEDVCPVCKAWAVESWAALVLHSSWWQCLLVGWHQDHAPAGRVGSQNHCKGFLTAWAHCLGHLTLDTQRLDRLQSVGPATVEGWTVWARHLGQPTQDTPACECVQDWVTKDCAQAAQAFFHSWSDRLQSHLKACGEGTGVQTIRSCPAAAHPPADRVPLQHQHLRHVAKSRLPSPCPRGWNPQHQHCSTHYGHAACPAAQNPGCYETAPSQDSLATNQPRQPKCLVSVLVPCHLGAER